MRPKPVQLTEDIVLRVVRGPNKHGYWYWRAIEKVNGKELTLVSDWGNPLDIAQKVQEIINNRPDPEELPLYKVVGVQDYDASNPETWGQLMDLWLKDRLSDPKLATASRSRYTRSTAKVRAGIGHVALTNRNALVEWRNSILTKDSDHTYNSYYQVIHAAWNWAFRQHWVSGDLPIKNQPRPVYKTEHYTPTDEEIQRIFDNMKGEPWELLALNICRYTGCRIGELAHMTWKEVDFPNKRITLSGKTGARHLPMQEKLYELLTAWKTFHPVAEENIFGVMPSTVLRYLNDVLHAACRDAGVQRYVTIHALRRAMVQRLRSRGVDVATAAHFMGHSIQVMLKVYTSVSEDDLKNALSSLEGSFEADE